MAEEKEGSAPEEQPEGSPSKPMSKLEQARAAARQDAEKSEETSEAPEQSPSKPMSKLELARAAAKEKSAEQAEASKPKSKLEQLRAAAAGKGAGPSDTKSKLAAARAAGGAKAEKPAAQGTTAGAKAPPPPMPKRPAAPAKAKAGSGDDRRFFLRLFGIGAILVTAWVAFSAACAVALAGTVRFMFPNVLTEPPSKFKIGSPGDYPPESVSTKWKAKFGIWVVNTTYNGQQEVYALRTVCTHLGCTPNWLDTERKFKCPCHGSGFYVTGINFEGPAPRPLERYAIRLAEDGQLEVDKSRLFQQELGQWEDTASFVMV